MEGWGYVRHRYRPDVFELDVRVSADNHPVVIHDRKVDRTTNGTGKVSETPLSHLKALDAAYNFTTDGGSTYPWRGKGVKVPTLTEVLDNFRHDHFNIEIKKTPPGLALQLADLIAVRRMWNQVLVLARDADWLDRLRHVDRRIPVAKVFSEKSLIARMATPAFEPLVKSLIKRAKRKGIQLEVWTVNDRGTMRLLLELGVDGLVTDRPDTALEVFREMGIERVERRPIRYVYADELDGEDLTSGGYASHAYTNGD